MTIEEFEKKTKQIYHEIRERKNEIRRISKEYAKENAPLKIGDKIMREGKDGIISDVDTNINFPTVFNYKWKPFKKDGSLSFERDLWGNFKKI